LVPKSFGGAEKKKKPRLVLDMMLSPTLYSPSRTSNATARGKSKNLGEKCSYGSRTGTKQEIGSKRRPPPGRGEKYQKSFRVPKKKRQFTLLEGGKENEIKSGKGLS